MSSASRASMTVRSNPTRTSSGARQRATWPAPNRYTRTAPAIGSVSSTVPSGCSTQLAARPCGAHQAQGDDAVCSARPVTRPSAMRRTRNAGSLPPASAAARAKNAASSGPSGWNSTVTRPPQQQPSPASSGMLEKVLTRLSPPGNRERATASAPNSTAPPPTVPENPSANTAIAAPVVRGTLPAVFNTVASTARSPRRSRSDRIPHNWRMIPALRSSRPVTGLPIRRAAAWPPPPVHPDPARRGTPPSARRPGR